MRMLSGPAVCVERWLIRALLNAEKEKFRESEAAEEVPIKWGKGPTTPTAVMVMIKPVPMKNIVIGAIIMLMEAKPALMRMAMMAEEAASMITPAPIIFVKSYCLTNLPQISVPAKWPIAKIVMSIPNPFFDRPYVLISRKEEAVLNADSPAIIKMEHST